ncbi:unnamed protein product [Caenorhabditis auriculariae]|uniref:Uncharacterized protein n=1 Tax=Caenorhabditis auriculariae TaxID=2777116 RepID=A0A8S1HW41_9PELO|nr:unnamed protein product [Caenorhabditis auriculariae]
MGALFSFTSCLKSSARHFDASLSCLFQASSALSSGPVALPVFMALRVTTTSALRVSDWRMTQLFVDDLLKMPSSLLDDILVVGQQFPVFVHDTLKVSKCSISAKATAFFASCFENR